MPELIDPVFTKTSPKCSFSVIQNERFGLVFAKTGSIISGTELEFFYKSMGARNRFIVPGSQDTYAGGIHSLEWIPGLHKRLKIRSQDLFSPNSQYLVDIEERTGVEMKIFILRIFARFHDNYSRK